MLPLVCMAPFLLQIVHEATYVPQALLVPTVRRFPSPPVLPSIDRQVPTRGNKQSLIDDTLERYACVHQIQIETIIPRS